MIHFTDQEIDQLIAEDVQYVDTTTSFLKLENKPAKIQFFTREPAIVCCTEEVMKIFNKTGIQTTLFTPSGEFLEKDVKFMEGEGLSGTLFGISRCVENLLCYSSGIASRARQIVEKAHTINKDIIIVTTRRTIPNTRKIAIKSVNAGGAAIHRFGLSESIIIYFDHYRFLGGISMLEKRIKERKAHSGGRSITVVVNNISDALSIINLGIDVLQFETASTADIKKLRKEIDKANPHIKLAISGNITIKNIQDFAGTGAEILISSWPYHGEPANIGVNILPIYDNL